MAGMTAGGTATLLLHPIDLVKVRFQLDRSVASHSTFLHMRELVRAYGGPRVLYQGLLANLAASTASWGGYFMLYEHLKRDYHLGPFWSAGAAGLVTQLGTCPLWVAKTRLCAQLPNRRDNFRGVVDCLSRTYRTEGVRGLYRGLVPGILGVSHGAVQFAVYERLKQVIPVKESALLYVIASSASKFVAVLVTYPYQVVRSRLQSVDHGDTQLIPVITNMIRREGLWSLYKGLGPSILRVLPATCVTFVTYESMKKFIKS